MIVLKLVGSRGQLTLGKRFAGKYFEMEVRPNGELLLRPVKLARDTAASVTRDLPAFEIAEVEHVVRPSREERNARR